MPFMHILKSYTPDDFMERAYQLAQRAQQQGEVPIGAVVVKNQKIIGEGWNSSITLHDPSAHAEIVALRAAASAIKNYRLVDTSLYVTLEPCAMCAYAMVHARIQHLFFGAYDKKTGAAGSACDLFSLPFVNHRVMVTGGILEEKCQLLLQDFFREKR